MPKKIIPQAYDKKPYDSYFGDLLVTWNCNGISELFGKGPSYKKEVFNHITKQQPI